MKVAEQLHRFVADERAKSAGKKDPMILGFHKRVSLGWSARIASSAIRHQERHVERVIEVLVPGPQEIVEHQFSHGELQSAIAKIARAVQRWKLGASRRSN
ncbi:hypothetical protein MPTK1_4g20630 [Marchantia polymorpha subsp. ruderalis]|uniref:Uncharacterized protein n=2 Tax=Marchantia polymorpha TaxID=3197 RepID=A0AAF6BC14_MARPO|nr:hypothetical protein MARPO_0101s0009 [Marchantia polymorpha]BBN09548.1 hypothetical protein Mp_4g20630 [Marchantia polymorpha subsp. ruderalis]|eukprot:PTQ32205.1 hypothetical protein MARPO_0101s0009 [Marchantia polymorpha]